MDDTSILGFKAITTFTGELSKLFGEKQRSLRLYCHLISKTTFVHEKAITKHINAFRKFCIDNRDAIYAKNHSDLLNTKIEYSTKAFINMKSIFEMADTETRSVIWSHVLIISAILDKTGKAKEILKQQAPKLKGGDIITSLMAKFEKAIDPNASSPAEAISSLIASGAITDITTTVKEQMQNGSLDLQSVLNSVSGMMSSNAVADCQDPTIKMLTSMLTTMIGNTSASNTGGGGGADIMAMLGNMNTSNTGGGADMMAMLGPLIGGMGIEKDSMEKLNKQLTDSMTSVKDTTDS